MRFDKLFTPPRLPPTSAAMPQAATTVIKHHIFNTAKMYPVPEPGLNQVKRARPRKDCGSERFTRGESWAPSPHNNDPAKNQYAPAINESTYSTSTSLDSTQ